MRWHEKPLADTAPADASSPTPIILIDRSPLFVQGCARLLGDYGYRVLGAACSLKELAGLADKLNTCDQAILVIGPLLSTRDGFAACRWAYKQAVVVRVIFISEDFANPILQADAARLGVSACLPGDTGPEQLLSVLTVVRMGHSLLQRSLEGINPLTECELRVLRKIGEARPHSKSQRNWASQPTRCATKRNGSWRSCTCTAAEKQFTEHAISDGSETIVQLSVMHHSNRSACIL